MSTVRDGGLHFKGVCELQALLACQILLTDPPAFSAQNIVRKHLKFDYGHMNIIIVIYCVVAYTQVDTIQKESC